MLLPWLCSACTETRRLTIQTVPTGMPALGATRSEGLTVVVHDRRTEPSLVGLDVSDPSNVAFVYTTKEPEALARTFEGAAMDAARTLGFREGSDVKIDIAIDVFRIDVHMASGYAPMNCIGYAVIETTLTPARNAASRSSSISRLAYWELTAGLRKHSLGKEAISRIYTQAAWEATTRILQESIRARPILWPWNRRFAPPRGRATIRAPRGRVLARSHRGRQRFRFHRSVLGFSDRGRPGGRGGGGGGDWPRRGRERPERTRGRFSPGYAGSRTGTSTTRRPPGTSSRACISSKRAISRAGFRRPRTFSSARRSAICFSFSKRKSCRRSPRRSRRISERRSSRSSRRVENEPPEART